MHSPQLPNIQPIDAVVAIVSLSEGELVRIRADEFVIAVGDVKGLGRQLRCQHGRGSRPPELWWRLRLHVPLSGRLVDQGGVLNYCLCKRCLQRRFCSPSQCCFPEGLIIQELRGRSSCDGVHNGRRW